MSRWTPKLFIVPTGIGSDAEQHDALVLRNRLIHSQLAPVLTITSELNDTIVAESVAAIEAYEVVL